MDDKLVSNNAGLYTLPCRECGEPITCSYEIRVREGERDEQGRLVIYVALVGVSIMDGCEHAEEMRNEYAFIMEGP